MNNQELSYLEKLFDERHEDNKGKFQTLFGKLDMIVDKIGKLPCKSHKTDLKWLIVGIRFIYTSVIGFLIYLRLKS